MSISTVMPTFEVDKEGLARIVGRKGKSFVLTELLQNAWDEDATRVDVTLEPGPVSFDEQAEDGGEKILARLVVEDDDPDGFVEIAHAYTLFADSEKKADAEKRGRFNIGEKYVIAVCEQATIYTTTGTVRFTKSGRIMDPPERDAGSKFVGHLLLTPDEYADIEATASRLLPPDGIVTTFNGQELQPRVPARVVEDKFWTEFGPELKRTIRKAEARLHEPVGDETAMIYEMGIPVVETGDRFHVDVQQKVPLNVERDNVTPAFLRDVRRIVVNHAHDLLTEDDGGAGWITDALEDEEVSPSALGAALKLRFGDKIVSRDPSDPEANKIAASEGYAVLSSGSLPPAVWKNVKAHGIVQPAGQVTPSPKPYLPGQENVRAVEPEDKWTPGMARLAEFSRQVAARIARCGHRRRVRERPGLPELQGDLRARPRPDREAGVQPPRPRAQVVQPGRDRPDGARPPIPRARAPQGGRPPEQRVPPRDRADRGAGRAAGAGRAGVLPRVRCLDGEGHRQARRRRVRRVVDGRGRARVLRAERRGGDGGVGRGARRAGEAARHQLHRPPADGGPGLRGRQPRRRGRGGVDPGRDTAAVPRGEDMHLTDIEVLGTTVAVDVDDKGVFRASVNPELEFEADGLDRLKRVIRDSVIATRVEVPFVNDAGTRGVMRGFHAANRDILVTWEDGEKGRITPYTRVLPADTDEATIEELRRLEQATREVQARLKELREPGRQAEEVFTEGLGENIFDRDRLRRD